MDWLKEFLQQAQTGSLKTAHYPKEFDSYLMKVSFGQGAPARVPWISFVTAGMSTSNGFYPVYLYYKDQGKLVLAFGISETNDFGQTWNPDTIGESPLIRDVIDSPPRYGDSWAFRVYDVQLVDGDVTISSDGNLLDLNSLQNDLSQILQSFALNLDEALIKEDSPVSAGLFYMEKQLEDFIIENWNTSELGSKYDLLYEEGVLLSQQYRTSIGPIDILAREKGTGHYVVIELKRNQTSDDTVGQVMRYMGWVSESLHDPGVKGVIIAGKYDTKLHYAQALIPNVDVYLYEVQFSLKEHKRR